MPFREDLKPDRLVAIEEEVLARWDAEKTFERVLEARAGAPPLGLLRRAAHRQREAGPPPRPLARGQGLRLPLEDDAGPPRRAEGRLGHARAARRDRGREEARPRRARRRSRTSASPSSTRVCRESVFGYLDDWKRMTRRMGYWVDLEHALRHLLARVRREPVVRSSPTSTRRDCSTAATRWCRTARAARRRSRRTRWASGFKDVQDPSVFVRFRALDAARAPRRPEKRSSSGRRRRGRCRRNVALAVHPDVDYVQVRGERGRATRASALWLAEARLAALGAKHDGRVASARRAATSSGAATGACSTGTPSRGPGPNAPSRSSPATFVTTTDGTGIVHIAPAYGAGRPRRGQARGPADAPPGGRVGEVPRRARPWRGQFVKDADKDILRLLKEQGRLWRRETLVHTYPHCWRCESPLLYYARDSWYVRTTAVQRRACSRTTRRRAGSRRPSGEGRFGQWLENNVDWAISRDRYWGTPLPLWVCDGRLRRRSRRSARTPTLTQKAGPARRGPPPPVRGRGRRGRCAKAGCTGTMRRTPEVADVWFDSGAMPFAQRHYPFENRERVEREVPADFIAEAVDQTRGWFYSLLAVAHDAPRTSPPTRACACMDLILDAQGKKMSKSRGNVVEPLALMDKHGADVVRWYLLRRARCGCRCAATRRTCVEVRNRFFGTLLHCYSFLAHLRERRRLAAGRGPRAARGSRPPSSTAGCSRA